MVSRLLSHYWTANDPPAARQAQIDDWIDDLIDFGPVIVADACAEWRRQPNVHRPTPGDIRALCISEERARSERIALAAPEDAWPKWLEEVWGPAPEGPRKRAAVAAEAARAREARDKRMQVEGRGIVNAWAQKQGHADIDAYAGAHDIHWSDAYKRCMTEILQRSAIARAIPGLKAADLGVKAREWTPEEMAAGRRQLGIEPEPETAAA